MFVKLLTINNYVREKISSQHTFMADPFTYFSFKPVLYNWCNKDHGMCYLVLDGAYKDAMMLIRKSSV